MPGVLKTRCFARYLPEDGPSLTFPVQGLQNQAFDARRAHGSGAPAPQR